MATKNILNTNTRLKFKEVNIMTLREIYETGAKNGELAKLLRDNGWSMIDLFNWIDFAKSQGYIK